MKSLTAAAAALFLFAATGVATAQEATGTNAGDSAGNQCTDYKPGTNFTQLSPKCREDLDSWVKGQTSASVAYEGEVAVGTVLPDTVTFVEVPTHTDYGYVMLKDRRVLVDRNNRTVIHIYD